MSIDASAMPKLRRPLPRPSSPPATGLATSVLLLAALLTGCGGGDSSAATAEAPPPTPLVATETVAEEAWRETVELSAELAPWAAVTVAAEAAGRVVELPIEHGDTVSAGQVVARLEAAGAEAELAQARARLASARASLTQAERDLERGRSLAGDDGILSADELDRLRLALDTGSAAAKEAEAAVAVAEERLADLVVRAPFDGVVSERSVELGSWVSPGGAVARIVDRRRIKVHAAASPEDRVRLRLDLPTSLHTEAFPDLDFAASLRFLGQESDPATGTYLVEAEVSPEAMSAAGRTLLPGMASSLRVDLAQHRGLVVPRTALVETTSGEVVFVVEDGVGRRRAVEVRPATPGKVEVLSGLAAGDELVVQGQHRLADGQGVEVKRGAAAPEDSEVFGPRAEATP
ncbi:MAG: efflux RND transporter periplasmic adaptor subunit [Acidobacteriota bacterium]